MIRVCLRADECSIQSHDDLFEERMSQIVHWENLICGHQIRVVVFHEYDFQFDETVVQVNEIFLRINLEVHGVDPRVERGYLHRRDAILRSVGGTLERFRRGFIAPLDRTCATMSVIVVVVSFPSSF